MPSEIRRTETKLDVASTSEARLHAITGSSGSISKHKDPEYLEIRKRNNDACQRSREKKRKLQREQEERLAKMVAENADLRRNVESLNQELSFFRNMFMQMVQKKAE